MRSFALILLALLPSCQNPSLPPLNPSASPSGIAPSASPVSPEPSPTAEPNPNPTPTPAVYPTQSADPTPTPFPTPSVMPGPPEPNPWPTGIGVHPSGAPVPTAPPEPTPHPGACSACTITWHEATQPTWLGTKLLYTDQDKQRTIDMNSPLGISTRVHPQIKQVAQPTNQSVWPSSTQLTYGDWKIYPLSAQEILVKREMVTQEPSLQHIQLTPQVQAQTLSTSNLVFQVAPGPNQTLAWLQYANSSSQVDLYTSSLQSWNPTKVGIARVAGADQFQWMPQGQGWAYIELNQSETPKPLIYRMSPEGQQSLWLTLPQVGPWPNKIRSFKFSPDGEHLAVIVDSMTVAADNSGIYWKGLLWVGSATGQNLRQIQTERLEADFDWSPDSQKLVVIAGKGEKTDSTHQGLYSILAADGKTQRVTGGTEAAVKYASPRWSPDGQQIAFTSNQKSDFRLWLEQPMELFTVSVSGDNLQRLSESRYQVEPLPAPRN